MKRTVLTIATALVIVFAGVVPASAMTVGTLKHTNPVAYDIKSLQGTHFYATVDTPNVYAVLKVKTSTGDVVVYKGAIANAGTFWFPVWNGLAGGKRLPSATYDYTLTISKGGNTATSSGKISVSRIFFTFSGTSKVFAVNRVQKYMKAGSANVYFRGTSTEYPDNLVMGLIGPGDYRGAFEPLYFDKFHPRNETIYLRSGNAPKQNGIHEFWMRGANAASYTITVIQ